MVLTNFISHSRKFIGALLCCLLLIAGCGKKEKEQAVEEIAPDTTQVVAATQTVVDSTLIEPVVAPNPNFSRLPIKSGYVNAQCLNVRSGAGKNAEIIGHVFKCDKLDIFEIANAGGTWYRVNDAAGYVDGWVSAGYISERSVPCDFIIPDDYKEPKTPTVIEGVSAKYVGVAACVPCHSKPHGEFSFGPYGVWRDHYHPAAYVTLTKSYTKAFAKKRGIDNPLTDWRCRKCHVTAFGVPAERLGAKYRDEDGVGCEACHGPGGDYFNKDHWTADPAQLRAMGFRIYTDLNERDQMCRACHNQLSPTYKPFNVEAFSAAIRHWTSEYSIIVSEEKPNEVVVEKPKPVETKQVEPVFEKFPEPVKPPEPPKSTEVTKSESPKPSKPAATGGGRLAGVPNDWMLDLKGSRGKVFFPHLKHQQKYITGQKEAEVCLVCHHKDQAGGRMRNCSDGACHKFEPTAVPNREAAFHGTCRTCHREEGSGPQKCSECHAQS